MCLLTTLTSYTHKVSNLQVKSAISSMTKVRRRDAKAGHSTTMCGVAGRVLGTSGSFLPFRLAILVQRHFSRFPILFRVILQVSRVSIHHVCRVDYLRW